MTTKQNITKTINRLFAIVILGLAAISCSNETYIATDPTPGKDEVMVRLSINTPQPTIPRATRGLNDQESAISQVKVLVFRQDQLGEYKFQYIANGENITTSGSNVTTFTALVRTTTTPTKLFILANADAAFEGYTPASGQDIETVKSMIKLLFDERLSSTLLPMYGEVTTPQLTATEANNLSTKMLRSIARVDVVNDLDTESTDFVLDQVILYRANDRLQVVPNALKDGQLKVEIPSLPSDATLQNVSQPIHYSGASLTNELNQSGNPIQALRGVYLPESESNLTDKIHGVTSVVVGGFFDKDTEPTYYRIDFDLKLEGHPYGQVLRNHKYIFAIRKVNGRGWATPEDAARNKSTNIQASVEQWNDFTTDMHFDAEHYFGVSTRKALLKYQRESVAEVIVSTDIDNYTIQWVEADGTAKAAPADLFNTTHFKVERVQENGQKKLKITSLTANSSYNNRVEYIMINANRWQIIITLTQQDGYVNTNRTIRLLSLNEVGNFGTTAAEPSQGSGALPIRRILDKQFKPSGVVKIQGMNYTQISSGQNNIDAELTDAVLSGQDIVFLNNNGRPNPATADRVMNWLNGSPKRVLIVSMDWKDSGVNYNTVNPQTSTTTNYNILKLLKNDITPKWYNGVNNHANGDLGSPKSSFVAPMTANSRNEYFWSKGPFTATPAYPDGFYVQDQYWGSFKALNPDIIPIFAYNDVALAEQRVVLGVDPVKRIVYVGDSQIFVYYANNLNRFSTYTGDVTTNYAKMISNLFAWMVEEVVLQ